MNVAIASEETRTRVKSPHSQRRRRRSNSSSSVYAHHNFKAVRAPRKDTEQKEHPIPRPPRLAYDVQNAYSTTRRPMTPPSRQEYSLSNMLYREDAVQRAAHRTSNPAFVDRALFNERIEKCTSFNGGDDDEDDDQTAAASDSDTLSCASSDDEDDPKLTNEVLSLRKEIESVKKSLAGMQRDHKAMLQEKQELQVQFQQAKSEANATLESSKELLQYNEMINTRMERLALTLEGASDTSEDELPEEYAIIIKNVSEQAKQLSLLQDQLNKSKKDFRELLQIKEDIEHSLADKEREYEERIRQYEAITAGKAGMIDSMELLLRELTVKMDRLIGDKENRQRHTPSGSTVSAKSMAASTKHRRKNSITRPGGSATSEQHAVDSNRKSDEFDPNELVPAYCLSPPQTRRVSYTNPISLMTEDELLRHQARFCPAKHWVEDSSVSQCQHAGCSVRFNLWYRRHHCRRCGNIFCNTHTAYKMLLFPDGGEDWGGVWSRVCEECFKDTK